MELKVLQNWPGQYNFMSDEEQLSVVIEIHHEGKVVTVGGQRARLQFMADPGERIDNPITDLSAYVDLAFGYAQRIISTNDYAAQNRAFITVLRDNWDEINDNFKRKRIAEINEEIEALKEEAQYASMDNNALDVAEDFAQNEITKLTKWKASQEEKAADFKEGSPSHNEAMATITRYELQIAEWNALL